MLLQSRGILWQGFDYKWTDHPHRLSYLGSRFEKVSDLSTEAELAAEHEMVLKIGKFPKDTAEYSVPYLAMRSDRNFIGWGRTSVVRLAAKIDHACTETRTLMVPIDDLVTLGSGSQFSPAKHAAVVVLLNGFRIESANFKSGWHFGRFAVSLSNARWHTPSAVAFDMVMEIRAAKSPDPFTDDLLSKFDYDDTPYQYDICLDYLVMVGETDHLGAHRIEEAAHIPSAKDESWCWGIAGSLDGYEHSFAGLSGLRFDLRDANTVSGRDGRYIRRLGTFLSETRLDLCQGFSNKGGIAYEWKLDASAAYTVVGMNGAWVLSEGQVHGITSEDRNVNKEAVSHRMPELEIGADAGESRRAAIYQIALSD